MAEVKRGFRKVTMVLPVKDYETLKRIAEENDREVGQQAAFMLKTGLQVHRSNNRVLDERMSGAWGEQDERPNGEAVDYTVPVGADEAEPVTATE